MLSNCLVGPNTAIIKHGDIPAQAVVCYAVCLGIGRGQIQTLGKLAKSKALVVDLPSLPSAMQRVFREEARIAWVGA